MDKLLTIFLLLFIVLTLFFIYCFYLYLFTAYKKATINYYRKKEEFRQYYKVEKLASQNRQIKNNVTKIIDSDLINQMVGYAMIEFLDEHNRTRSTHTIYKHNYKIGRDGSNDIVLHNQTVSRQQCLIELKSGKFFIHNLSSYSPIKVNGVSVNKLMELQFGNIIEIANYRIRFCDVTNVKNAG